MSDRIDSTALSAAVDQATVKLSEIEVLLSPFLELIDEQTRASQLRPRDGFQEAIQTSIRALEDFPTVAQVAGFEQEAVLEDVNNVEALKPLVERMNELAQRLSDSRLVWLSQAFAPSLVLYQVARGLLRTTPGLRAVVDPLSALFPGKKGSPTSSSESEGG